MSAAAASGQFGDTTYTKVFVGGLAWETKREAMKNYFDQFGDILEAVVITDKHTGRSKGYGFVTFCDPESAKKACIDPSPVIDGRRANCNLASLGVQRTRPTTPQHGGNMRRSFREMKSFDHAAAAAAAGLEGGMGAAFPCAASTFPHYHHHHHALQQGGCPCDVSYGYYPYSTDYTTYLSGYYSAYNGAGAGQYPPMYIGANGVAAAAATGTTAAFYPYFQFGEGGSGAAPYAQGMLQAYAVQYPHMFQYPAAMASSAVSEFAAMQQQQQQYGGSMSSTVPTQPGMTMALQAPALPAPASHHHCRLIPTHLA